MPPEQQFGCQSARDAFPLQSRLRAADAAPTCAGMGRGRPHARAGSQPSADQRYWTTTSISFDAGPAARTRSGRARARK